jgi:lipopolysaccharide transport system ATP-binding protein
LEPEILIIDEVLAVGDAEFQKKCLGKMREVASGSGRTIFFVSHQLESVVALCTRVCLLQAGRLEADGGPDKIVQLYHNLGFTNADGAPVTSPTVRPGRGTARIKSVRPKLEVFEPNSTKIFRVEILSSDYSEAPFYLALRVKDQSQRPLFILDSHHANEVLNPCEDVELSVILRSPWLCPGNYNVDAYLYNYDIIDAWEDACRFCVSSRMPYQNAISQSVIKGSLVLPEFYLSKRLLNGTGS